MSPDLAPIENVWQLPQDEIKKKKLYKLSIFDFRNKSEMEVFATWTCLPTLVHRMNNRISEVIKSDGDFILG